MSYKDTLMVIYRPPVRIGVLHASRDYRCILINRIETCHKKSVCLFVGCKTGGPSIKLIAMLELFSGVMTVFSESR